MLAKPVQARRAIGGCLRHLGFGTHVGEAALQPDLCHVDVLVPLTVEAKARIQSKLGGASGTKSVDSGAPLLRATWQDVAASSAGGDEGARRKNVTAVTTASMGAQRSSQSNSGQLNSVAL